MAYQPIENYGIIGNMHTVALVGMNGSIDWFCDPHFDSPSVFGAISTIRRVDATKSRPRRMASPTSRSTGQRPTCWLPDSSRRTASGR